MTPHDAIRRAFEPEYGKDNPIVHALVDVGGRMHWCADTNCMACVANVDALKRLADAFPAREG